MRKIAFIFCIVLFCSCKTQQITLSPFVAIYRSDLSAVDPQYISLKTKPNVFEKYSPGVYLCTVGEWNINNDTLFLFPLYEYGSNKSGLIFSKITSQDSSVTTIPQKYIIKKDCLIDITDYNVFLKQVLFIQNHKTIYKRINSQ